MSVPLQCSASVRGSGHWTDESGNGEGGFESIPGRIPPSEYYRNPMYKKHTFWIEVKLAAGGS